MSSSFYALLLIAQCFAHMVLHSPVPYGNATLNNSPLDDSGLDFPCKQREGVYDVALINEWKVGEKQMIQFAGSAVHAGGSCQFSVTTDTHPTKATQWKVVHSIVGGCPASVDRNLEETEHPASFELVLPMGMPNGRYTLAWTWFNKRGPREMYMNCAPVLVSGGTNDVSFFEKLPDMFVANLPVSSCATVEGFDFSFPQPGDSVQYGEHMAVGTILTGEACQSVTRLGAGAGTMRAPDTHPQGSSSYNLPASQRTPSAKSNLQVPGNSISASSKASPMAVTKMSAMVTGAASCVACDDDGDIVCIGDLHFGICNRQCATPQAVAEGMTCVGNSIVKHAK
jgi:hypothetical protein